MWEYGASRLPPLPHLLGGVSLSQPRCARCLALGHADGARRLDDRQAVRRRARDTHCRSSSLVRRRSIAVNGHSGHAERLP